MATQTEEKKSAGEVMSDVLNQAKDGILSFGETVANKSKEMMSSAKLAADKAHIEKQNEDYYLQMGKLAHQHKSYTDKMAKLSGKIDANDMVISDLESQIEAVHQEYEDAQNAKADSKEKK